MKEFQVVAMDSAVAREFRDSKSDYFGNRAIVRTADYPNAYPCRHCLHDADQGTDLLLLAYR
ncbi:MAG: DUF1203 domain-containing protein, partial [Fimbriimonadaceae bacterium]|nr:DUF1203 domain-containing protein [Alphaproteobacteria bacterium]